MTFGKLLLFALAYNNYVWKVRKAMKYIKILAKVT